MLLAAPHAEKVSKVFDEWLSEEMREAAAGRNSENNNHNTMRRRLALEPAARDLELRAFGHFDRYRHKMSLYPEGLGDLFFLAIFTHHALMFTAGGYRAECMLTTLSQDEYNTKRQPGSPATSVNVAEVTREAFAEIRQYNLYGKSAINAFVAWHLAKNEEVLSAKLATEAQAVAMGTRLTPDSEAIVAAQKVQKLGIIMAASNVVMAASLLGGYEHAPFLAAKSISDVPHQPLYPLAH